MEKRLGILVVNDDGIEAEGIAHLAAMAARLGEVWVAAPDAQCSGMSQKLTLFEEMPVTEYAFPVPVSAAWRIGGTPADCVKVAIECLLPRRPDYVFSGVNRGFNAGFDTAYSGTIGAALEGLMKGVSAIAFSNDVTDDFSCVDEYLLPITRELLSKMPEDGALWNVNFPGCPLSELKGVLRERRVARTQLYRDSYEEVRRADGSFALRCRGRQISAAEAPEGTDVAAVLNGYISIGTLRCPVL